MPGEDGRIVIPQVDAILFREGEAPDFTFVRRASFDRCAAELFGAILRGASLRFERVVAVVSYRDDTREMVTDFHWNDKAGPWLVTPETWHRIADELNPFATDVSRA